MKFVKKNKEFIVVFLFIILIIIINAILGIYQVDTETRKSITAYSIREYSFNCGLGTIFIICSPLLIITACLLPFFYEIKTGFIEYSINRISYKQYMKKKIINCHKKSLLLFPFISVLVIIIGILIFGTTITTTNTSITYFEGKNTPVLFTVLSILALIVYSSTIINFGLILTRFINKFYLLLIAIFIMLFFIAYIEANVVGMFFGDVLGIASLSNISIFRWIVSSMIIYKLYKNQESMVLANEK